MCIWDNWNQVKIFWILLTCYIYSIYIPVGKRKKDHFLSIYSLFSISSMKSRNSRDFSFLRDYCYKKESLWNFKFLAKQTKQISFFTYNKKFSFWNRRTKIILFLVILSFVLDYITCETISFQGEKSKR